MNRFSYAIVDAFTDTPLQGNPVAIFRDGSSLDDELMQRAARELHLSETVFLLPATDAGRADARARIFTPTAELPFAGHPLLGTAFLLGAERGLDAVRLETGAGLVRVTLEAGYGEMEQPLPRVERFAATDQLLAALGVERPALPVEAYVNGPRHLMVALDDEAAVSALDPDLGALRALGELGVSCFARVPADRASANSYRTRMFAPGLGVPEDPATGSAAGPLAVHLLRHGKTQPGEQIEIRQGGEIGRPSLLKARVEGSAEQIDRVMVGGAAVIVARGEYRLR